MARVVVIGGGMGGLAAAARLAALGHEVALLERAQRLGGKLGRLERDGLRFDTGPHLLTMPQVFEDLFTATGGTLGEEVRLRRVDPACRYRFPDGLELDVPGGDTGDVAAAWGQALGPAAEEDWLRFSERARRIWDATRVPFLESPLDGAGTLLALARSARDLRTVAPWRTLRGLGRHYLRSPHQRRFLDRYATYTGSDPRRAPAALATVPYVEQRFGSWYVEGGLGALGDAVAARARACGAQLHPGTGVRRVLLDAAGRARGVVLENGERLAADVVVSDADAHHLYRDLLPDAAPARRQLARIRSATPSLSGLVLLLAVRTAPRAAAGRAPAHHRVLFCEDYDDEFDSVFGTGPHRRTGPRPVPDPTVYVSAPGDPELGDTAGRQGWFVLVNAPRHDPGAGVSWDDADLTERYADRVLEVMAARGCDVRDRLDWRVVRTPADLARETSSVGGTIYGSSSNGARSAFLRPANRSPVPGLYLVGGSAHPGGGLPLVALSARIVAGLVGPA